MQQLAILKIETSNPTALTQAQLEILAEALKHRFVDAKFEITAAPEYMKGWHPSKLSAKLREIYDLLANAEDYVRLDHYAQARVYVNRLNHKLPEYYKVVAKRNHGYKLIDLRREQWL